MPEREEISLRQLPGGRLRQGLHRGVKGRLLEVEMSSAEQAAGLDAGALVEVGLERALYLGEVYSRHGIRLTIAVDHVVDREALAAIQDVWGRVGRQ